MAGRGRAPTTLLVIHDAVCMYLARWAGAGALRVLHVVRVLCGNRIGEVWRCVREVVLLFLSLEVDEALCESAFQAPWRSRCAGYGDLGLCFVAELTAHHRDDPIRAYHGSKMRHLPGSRHVRTAQKRLDRAKVRRLNGRTVSVWLPYGLGAGLVRSAPSEMLLVMRFA